MTEHLINRPAKLTQCSRCDAVTMTGITGGLTVTVDVKPLTINGEIAALLTGRMTFALHAIGHSVHLELRGLTEIRAGRSHSVVALHQCRGARQIALVLTDPRSEEMITCPSF